MSGIAVAIVNADTREELRACLATVLAECPEEVVVVDNASVDGSVALVEHAYPGVRLLANATNVGYGSAANQALSACRAPYVLLLNSDTRLAPGALAALASYLDGHPRAAVVGPRLANADGTLQASCYPFPTPLDTLLENSVIAVKVGRFIRRHIRGLRDYYLRTWSHDTARVVPWVKGAALTIRRTAFGAVGGFDPAFFMYSEDTDLCYRLATAGWEIHFAPVTTVVHVGSASTDQRRAEMSAHFIGSTLQFYQRHGRSLHLVEAVLILKGLVLGRLVRDSLERALTRDGARRTELGVRIAWWRQVLRGRWLPRRAHSYLKGNQIQEVPTKLPSHGSP